MRNGAAIRCHTSPNNIVLYEYTVTILVFDCSTISTLMCNNVAVLQFIIIPYLLQTLGNEACKDRSLLSDIVVPVMDTMALLLRRGEMFLSNPHHVTLSFRTLLTVPLDHLRFEEYHGIFLAVHEVLFSILQCHSKVHLYFKTNILQIIEKTYVVK